MCKALESSTDCKNSILKAIKDFKSDNDLDKAMNIINSLGITIKDGFSLKDSVYQKEELKL